jgi:diaminopimelate epimerase
MSIETLAGARKVELSAEGGVIVKIKVDMGKPQVKRKEAQVSGKPNEMMVDEEVDLDGFKIRITAVGMGNPHAVVLVDNLDLVDVTRLGRKIRNYEKLFPKGINVHFIQNVGRNAFKIRTYERGVEDETLACGTGICASAVAAVLTKKANPAKEIVFHAKGGSLEIKIEARGQELTKVEMTGPAEKVFEGSYEFKK